MHEELIKVYDDFLDGTTFPLVQKEAMYEIPWYAGGRSSDNQIYNHHWHFSRSLTRNDRSNIPLSPEEFAKFESEYPNTYKLWNQIVNTFNDKYSGFKPSLRRCYSNMHTYGMESQIHQDDGHYTALYYPNPTWNINHEGGTCFYDMKRSDALKYVSYKPNRLIIFRAFIPHRAMPVTRDCFWPRINLVFKIDEQEKA